MGKVCSVIAERRARKYESWHECSSGVQEQKHDQDSFRSIRLSARGQSDCKILAAQSDSQAENVPATSSGNCCKRAYETSRRRSVLIGINYYETPHELHGCVNDVLHMLPVLRLLGFSSSFEHQRVLTDGHSNHKSIQPTRKNILEALEWLVDDARPGDVLYLHYSGHAGKQLADGQLGAEAFVPSDFVASGLVEETELRKVLLNKLPPGCRLTCVIDSCRGTEAPLGLESHYVGGVRGLAAAKSVASGTCPGVEKARSFLSKMKPRQVQQPGPEVLVLASQEIGPNESTRSRLSNASVSEEKFGDAVGDNVPAGSLYVDSTRSAGGPKWGSGGILSASMLQVLKSTSVQSPTILQVLETVGKDFEQQGSAQVPVIASTTSLNLQNEFRLDSATSC